MARLVSTGSFEQILEQYGLSERTIRNLKRRFELDGKIDYPTFLDEAVALYVDGASGDKGSDEDSDGERVKSLSDSDDRDGSSSDSSMSSANTSRHKLQPTVEEAAPG